MIIIIIIVVVVVALAAVVIVVVLLPVYNIGNGSQKFYVVECDAGSGAIKIAGGGIAIKTAGEPSTHIHTRRKLKLST